MPFFPKTRASVEQEPDTETHDWSDTVLLSRLRRAARAAAGFVELDGLAWTALNPDRGRHVHELVRAHRGARRWLAKSADVWRPLGSTGTGDYRSFHAFAESLFEEGDGTVPIRRIRHPDEPEIPDREFRSSLVHRNMEALASISDETPPREIEDADLRALFVLYRGRKERLILAQDREHENVFTHHGRDVILEVFSSLFGRALGVAVPQNRFGLRTFEFAQPGKQGRVRHRMPYALSAMIAPERCLNLLGFLRDSAHADLAHAMGWELHSANPLSLQFFLGEVSGAREEAGRFLLEGLERAADLIRSDLLDVLLDAREDRSIEEFLLPRGGTGPVYTVDFGESLFPELALSPGEPHFLQASRAHCGRVVAHFRRAQALPEGNVYRRETGRMLARFLRLPDEFYLEFFSRIPDLLLGGEAEAGRYGLDVLSPPAHLAALRGALLKGLGLPADTHHLAAALQEQFH